MEKFTRLEGIAAPLLVPNIDTGALAPSHWSRDHPEILGAGLLRSWRYDSSDQEIPDFVLNRPRYRNTKILIAGLNFGCGSSRETAVWALLDFGIRCVIAPSFGDIFYDNAFQNGLLPIRLSDDEVAGLVAAVETLAEPVMAVDLEACHVEIAGRPPIHFDVSSERRMALLEGLDETLAMRRMEPEIAAFRARDRESRPWVYALPPDRSL